MVWACRKSIRLLIVLYPTYETSAFSKFHRIFLHMSPRSLNVRRSLGSFTPGPPFLPAGELLSIRTPTALESHRHTCWEITFLRKGEVTWEISNGLRLNVHGGQIALTQPKLRHRGELDKIRPCELLWLWVDPLARNTTRFSVFSSRELAQIRRTLVAAGNVVVQAESACGAHYDQLKHLLDQKAKSPEGVLLDAQIRICMADLFLGFVRSLAVRTGRENSRTMHAVMQLLSQNLDDKNMIDQAVRFSGLKRSRFFERFKNEVGLSPHEFVLRKRCEVAQSRLHSDSTLITTMALDLGFCSSQHFAACFKNVVGMTPSQYRTRATPRFADR